MTKLFSWKILLILINKSSVLFPIRKSELCSIFNYWKTQAVLWRFHLCDNYFFVCHEQVLLAADEQRNNQPWTRKWHMWSWTPADLFGMLLSWFALFSFFSTLFYGSKIRVLMPAWLRFGGLLWSYTGSQSQVLKEIKFSFTIDQSNWGTRTLRFWLDSGSFVSRS